MARRKRNARRGRRRNAQGMPVVLVNPENPRRRRRRRRRGNPRHRARRSNPRRGRRRNPTVTFGKAFVTFALAGLGGGLAYGLDWGISHAKVSATIQAVGFVGVGLLGTLGIARWGDERVAAGLAGATIFGGIGRVREAIALSKAAQPTTAPATKPAVGAGAVYTQPYGGAGAVMHMQGNPQRLGARAMGPGPAFGQSFKEAAALRANPSYYMPGPIRWYGPRSWAYQTEAGVVRRYVSAHSR